jgi:hypothetical protein
VAREVLDDLGEYWSLIGSQLDQPAVLLASIRELLDVLERVEGIRPTRSRP